MSDLKQRWGSRICSLIPLDIWHRLLNIELVLPHWHVVSDQKIEHITGLYQFRNIQQFKADLEFFLKFYAPVSLNDIINYLNGSIRLPKRCFLPTFDDGFREIYDVIAPILYSQGIPAIFFLITSAIDNKELCYPQKKSILINAISSLPSCKHSHVKKEILNLLNDVGCETTDLTSKIRSIYYRQKHLLDEMGSVIGCDFTEYVSKKQPYLASEHVRNLMKMGFEIGAHSIDHPLYSELTLVEQLVQTHASVEWLSTNFQYNCRAFAFPYGDVGISQEFFQKVFSHRSLNISFGIGGIRNRYSPNNLPRFSMERTNLPAKLILARQFGRAILQWQ